MNTAKTAFLYVLPISATALALEIALTRFFSVMFEYHYSFLLISLAILGLGLGSAWVYFGKGDNRALLELSPIGISLSTLLLVLSLVLVPFTRTVPLAALLALLPFFFAGVSLSGTFMRYPQAGPFIYGADLAGAALGTLATLKLMQLGAVNFILLLAGVVLLPAFFPPGAPSKSGRLYSIKTITALAALLLFFLNLYPVLNLRVPFSKHAFKEMQHYIQGSAGKAEVVETEWSAFGRTDLLQNSDRPNEKVFFIDGTAGSTMFRNDGTIESAFNPALLQSPALFALQGLKPNEQNSMLIIGSGGGKDVMLGRMAGVENITAVEVNRDMVEIAQDYSTFNGGIYSGTEGVEVEIAEGRNFIRSTDRQFDIILLSIPVTKTSRSPEGYALTENYLFTEESIRDYLNRLTPEGRIVVVAHSEMEIFKLIFTSLAALEGLGISSSSGMQRIYSLGDSMFPVFVLKRYPVSAFESYHLHRLLHRRGFTSKAPFIPNIDQLEYNFGNAHGDQGKPDFMLHNGLYLLAQGKISPESLRSHSKKDLSAVTDDRPFFYHFDSGLPRVILLSLIISLVLLALLLISHLYLRKAVWPKSNPHSIHLIGAVFLLGSGFMLAEIPLIQKYILFLGHPVYSMAILLISLLAGAACGSSWAGWASRRKSSMWVLQWSALCAGVVIAGQLVLIDSVFPLLMGTSIFWRFLFSAVCMVPLGFFLGMPFPMCMRILDEQGMGREIAWAWAVNSIASVLGSSGAIALALKLGYSPAILLSAALYFLLAAVGFAKGSKMRDSSLTGELHKINA